MHWQKMMRAKRTMFEKRRADKSFVKELHL